MARIVIFKHIFQNYYIIGTQHSISATYQPLELTHVAMVTLSLLY